MLPNATSNNGGCSDKLSTVTTRPLFHALLSVGMLPDILNSHDAHVAAQVHGAVGLRTLLSAQHSVQLTPESSASLVASWQPNVGLGLQFVSQRQLSSTINGEYSWVVGPPEASGMSLGLTRRTEKTMLSGRLEVRNGG